jgi:MFS family permease
MKDGIAGPAPIAAEAGERTAPASRVRYYVLAFACALAVVTYIQRLGFVSAGSPYLKSNAGLNSADMGYLTAAFLVAYGLFQVPGGLLGDRFGGRHVLTVLVVGWSLVTGTVALTVLLPAVAALQFSLLLVQRFVFGGLQAGGFPVLGRIMADWMPLGERGFAQGAIWTVSRLGGFLIPFLFIWFFQWSKSLAIPFVLIACLGVLWCGVFWPWFRNRPEEMPQVNQEERERIAAGRSGLTKQSRSVPWRQAARSLSVWCLCLMYGCTGFSGNFFTSMLPLYLTEQRGLTFGTTTVVQGLIIPTGIGDDSLLLAQGMSRIVESKDNRIVESQDNRRWITWLQALPLAGGAVSCVLGGALSDWLIRRWGNRKWGRRAVGAFGLTLAGMAFLPVHWAGPFWLLGLLLTLSFFGNDFTMGPAWASCADIGERYAGTLSGLMNMIGALFGACGMTLVGYLLLYGRPQLMFLVLAAVYFLAALCWLGVDVTKRLTDAT